MNPREFSGVHSRLAFLVDNHTGLNTKEDPVPIPWNGCLRNLSSSERKLSYELLLFLIKPHGHLNKLLMRFTKAIKEKTIFMKNVNCFV